MGSKDYCSLSKKDVDSKNEESGSVTNMLKGGQPCVLVKFSTLWLKLTIYIYRE